MTIFTDAPIIRGARAGKLIQVAAVQTTTFASADANGFYQFTDGAGGALSYTVASGNKAYLSFLSVYPVTTTHTGIVAFYLGSTIQAFRAHVPSTGLCIPLDQLSGLNGSYVPETTTIELRIIPSALDGDWFASFFGWYE